MNLSSFIKRFNSWLGIDKGTYLLNLNFEENRWWIQMKWKHFWKLLNWSIKRSKWIRIELHVFLVLVVKYDFWSHSNINVVAHMLYRDQKYIKCLRNRSISRFYFKKIVVKVLIDIKHDAFFCLIFFELIWWLNWKKSQCY